MFHQHDNYFMSQMAYFNVLFKKYMRYLKRYEITIDFKQKL